MQGTMHDSITATDKCCFPAVVEFSRNPFQVALNAVEAAAIAVRSIVTSQFVPKAHQVFDNVSADEACCPSNSDSHCGFPCEIQADST
jgi:hypothetical protein